MKTLKEEQRVIRVRSIFVVKADPVIRVGSIFVVKADPEIYGRKLTCIDLTPVPLDLNRQSRSGKKTHRRSRILVRL